MLNSKQRIILLKFIASITYKNEIWKQMYLLDNRYHISNYGRIVSLCHGKPKLLQAYQKQGYLYITVKRKAYRVHRLVATYFLPNPDRLPIVHHKDHNKKNNMVSNLSWVSHSDNQKAYVEYKSKRQKR